MLPTQLLLQVTGALGHPDGLVEPALVFQKDAQVVQHPAQLLPVNGDRRLVLGKSFVQPGSAAISLTRLTELAPFFQEQGEVIQGQPQPLAVTGVEAGKSYRGAIDLLEATLRERPSSDHRRTLAGSLVNLERSLPANGRLGGHFVTGHIDGIGKIFRWRRAGSSF